MNTPPVPPSNAPKGTSIASKLKPTVSFGVQGRKDKNLVILTLSMFAVGLFLVIYGVYEIKGSQESRNWPSTQGTIVYSGVHDFTTRDSNHRTKTSYSPKISYRYRVGGREYTSERFHFGVGESGGSRKSAQKNHSRISIREKSASLLQSRGSDVWRPVCRFQMELAFNPFWRAYLFRSRCILFESVLEKQAENLTVTIPWSLLEWREN